MSLRHAATVCVVRPARDAFEVLLGKRGEGAAFVGGAYVFPGGAVDPIDIARAGDNGDAAAFAAVRETFEEMAIAVTHSSPSLPRYRSLEFADIEAGTDPMQLSYVSTWVTPAFLPIRFDTRFYLAEVGADTDAVMDGYEFVDAAWVTPEAALRTWLPARGRVYRPRLPISTFWQPSTRFRMYGRDSPRNGISIGWTSSSSRASVRRVFGVRFEAMNIEKILAPNPSVFTGPGTNTYLLDSGGEDRHHRPWSYRAFPQEAIEAASETGQCGL